MTYLYVLYVSGVCHYFTHLCMCVCVCGQVAENVTALGVQSWPLLSSWPHPEEFMQWMREAFAAPEVFTAQVSE